MSENEVIEGEFEEEMSREIQRTELAVMPVMDITDAERRYKQMVEFVNRIMKDGVDYGTIPGTSKPTLYKPGAEKLSTLFGLRNMFIPMDKIENWDEENAMFFYRYKAQLWKGDWLIAEGIGSASSKEDRYRWRWVSEERVPPYLDPQDLEKRGGKVSEFEFAIKEGRTEGEYAKPQEYWDRFRAAIADGTAKSILKQARSGKEYDAWEIDATYYRIPNPDVFTQVNTIDKMAQKRAFIQAVLIGVNASEFFTQDVEDMPIETLSGEEDRYTPPPQYQKTKKEQPPKSNGKRPYPPHIVRERINDFITEYKGERKDQSRPGGTLVTFIAWQMNECFQGDSNPDGKRISVLNYLFERKIESTSDLTGAELRAVERWLQPGEYDGEGAGIFPRKEAKMEAMTIFTTHLKEQGQQELDV